MFAVNWYSAMNVCLEFPQQCLTSPQWESISFHLQGTGLKDLCDLLAQHYLYPPRLMLMAHTKQGASG